MRSVAPALAAIAFAALWTAGLLALNPPQDDAAVVRGVLKGLALTGMFYWVVEWVVDMADWLLDNWRR